MPPACRRPRLGIRSSDGRCHAAQSPHFSWRRFRDSARSQRNFHSSQRQHLQKGYEMRAVVFIFGLVVGLGFGVGGLTYPNGLISTEFTRKVYHDDNSDVVTVSGTLTGEIEFPNNSCSIGCYRDLKQCWFACVQATGGSQLGPITAPFFHEVSSWTDKEIVATSAAFSGALVACYRTTIKIERLTEHVLWVEEPVNRTEPICKDSENKTRKSSIEDGPTWKNILAKRNRFVFDTPR